MNKNYDFDKVITTTAWSPGPGCHGGCGVKLYVKDDKVVHVEGDPCHPFSQGRTCSRLMAMTQYMYHAERLKYPMKRVGERGEGKWQRISWDEAFDTIEKKFNQIKEESGPESVIFSQGTGRDIGGPISFLCYSFGSPNWMQLGLAGHSCYTPRLGAMTMVQGDFAVADCSQFLEKRYDDPEYKLPKYIIIWAQNPQVGCPDGFYGSWIADCMKRGTKIIVIDPRWTWYASRAEKYIRIRPGTDGCLAMGMINLIIQNDWYDHEFVEKWCYGFEELKERAKEYPIDFVSKTTWIPEEDIYELTKLYATNSPSAIHWGLPIDQGPEGTTIAQAITDLWCITGNLDVPGGNVIARNAFMVTTYPFDNYQMAAMYGEEMMQRINEKRIGAKEYPYLASFRGWAQPDLAVEQMLTGKPYPIRAAWIQTSNPLGGQAANMKKHYDALMKMEFNVVVDTFHTPTTEAIGDLLLPAATFAEKESFRAWYQPLQLIQPAVTVDECKSDWEINLELARRFNPRIREQFPTFKDVVNSRIKDAGFTWDSLSKAGGWAMPPKDDPSYPYHRYETGKLRPDGKPGFRTPTGKVELYSTRLKDLGYDPLPYFVEPPESEVRTPELFEKYPYVMVTGRRSPMFFHSEHRNIPWLRENDPWPLVEVSPETAEKYGVNTGDWLGIYNDRGKIVRRVKVNPSLDDRIISVPHGWWLPEEKGKDDNNFGVWDINCNLLVPVDTQSSTGYGGGAYKTTLAGLFKLSEEEQKALKERENEYLALQDVADGKVAEEDKAEWDILKQQKSDK